MKVTIYFIPKHDEPNTVKIDIRRDMAADLNRDHALHYWTAWSVKKAEEMQDHEDYFHEPEGRAEMGYIELEDSEGKILVNAEFGGHGIQGGKPISMGNQLTAVVLRYLIEEIDKKETVK